MNFGSNSKNDYDRVMKSMLDNDLRDPQPSLRSLVGNDHKVLNLRPLNKSMHVNQNAPAFRYKASSQMERVMELNLNHRNNSIMVDDIGLPPLNQNHKEIFKSIKAVRKNKEGKSVQKRVVSQESQDSQKSKNKIRATSPYR